MPKVRLLKSQALDDNFRAIVREAMERNGIHWLKDISRLIGAKSPVTGNNKFDRPETLTLRELRMLSEKLGIPPEKWADIIR